MPALPELLEAGRPVRLSEVLREPEPQEQGYADGDVAVAAEVAVDLEGVAVDGQHGLQARGTVRIGEHTVDQFGGQQVGDEDLLEQAAQDELQGAADVHR